MTESKSFTQIINEISTCQKILNEGAEVGGT